MLVRIAGLFILILLTAMAVIPALFAMNFLTLPAYEEWDKFLTNVGYGVVAGAILLLLAAVIERVLILLRPNPESQ